MTHAARRALLVLLLPALLLAQTLGLLHGTLHAGTGAPAAGTSLLAKAPHAKGWVADLFAAHADGSSCRLYDQLSHGDLAPPAAPLVAALQGCAATPFVLLAAVALAAAAPFQARAPPASR